MGVTGWRWGGCPAAGRGEVPRKAPGFVSALPWVSSLQQPNSNLFFSPMSDNPAGPRSSPCPMYLCVEAAPGARGVAAGRRGSRLSLARCLGRMDFISRKAAISLENPGTEALAGSAWCPLNAPKRLLLRRDLRDAGEMLWGGSRGAFRTPEAPVDCFELNIKLVCVLFFFGISLFFKKNRIKPSASFCASDLAGGGGAERGPGPLVVLIARAGQKVGFSTMRWEIRLWSAPEGWKFSLRCGSPWELLSKLQRAAFCSDVAQGLQLFLYLICKTKLSGCPVSL